jgi:hypothetical protein
MKPGHKDFLSVLGHLYLTSGKNAKARKVYEVLHAEFPEDRECALALAFARLECGDANGAVILADMLLSADAPDGAHATSFARLVRARALWAKGDRESARAEMIRFFSSRRPSATSSVPAVPRLRTGPGASNRRASVQA